MAWSAQQYVKFEDERTRPARDLFAQVPLADATRAYDLGCGPGNSTELLVERFGAGNVIGLDSDDNMLAAAAKRLPDNEFLKADLNTWTPEQPADLLYANAVFQWVPDHIAVLARLMDHLKPGGVLAVQMPDNLTEPSHVLMEETGAAGPWAPAFEGRQGKAGRSALTRCLHRCADAEIHPRRCVAHDLLSPSSPMPRRSSNGFRATGLRPYLDAAGAKHAEAFAADYTARIAAAYPQMADGRVLLRFPRLFIVAVKS